MYRNIKLLSWFNFFSDFTLYAPIAIIYFSQVSGSYVLGMSIFAIARVSSALFEVPTGIFSDRIGRRKTLILGAAAAIAFATFYAIGHSFWILVIGAILEGLSRSFYSGNNEALLYDTLAEKNQQNKYAEYLGKTSKMNEIALALSALAGGLFLIKGSIGTLLWLSVISQIICLIIAFKFIEPKTHSNKSGNIYKHLKIALVEFMHNPKLRLLSLTSIIGSGFGEASYHFQSAFFATVWPVWAISFTKTFNNALSAFSFHYSGRIIKRFNVFKVILLGQFYTRSIIIFSAGIPTVLSPILMSSTSVFWGVLTVGRNTLMQKEFKDEQRATMGSLNSFAASIVFGITAVSLGFTADKLSPAMALILLQFFQSANIFIYYKLFKSHSADKIPQPLP